MFRKVPRKTGKVAPYVDEKPKSENPSEKVQSFNFLFIMTPMAVEPLHVFSLLTKHRKSLEIYWRKVRLSSRKRKCAATSVDGGESLTATTPWRWTLCLAHCSLQLSSCLTAAFKTVSYQVAGHIHSLVWLSRDIKFELLSCSEIQQAKWHKGEILVYWTVLCLWRHQ